MFPLTCVRFSPPVNPLGLESLLSTVWIGTGSETKNTNVPTKDLAMNGAHDDVDGTLNFGAQTCATIKHHKQLCPTLGVFSDAFRKQTDNSPRSHTKFSVLPLCHFRLDSADYWARLTTSRGSFICPPTLENGYNVQQKGFTISQQRPQDNCPRPKAYATITN